MQFKIYYRMGCGGGERVLWNIILSIQEYYPNLKIHVYIEQTSFDDEKLLLYCLVFIIKKFRDFLIIKLYRLLDSYVFGVLFFYILRIMIS